MTRKILVLDAFTHGHAAALEFIQRQGWSVAECDLIFCGTHDAVFKQLMAGPAYAVVPVWNSTVKEIAEVTTTIAQANEWGYDFVEQDRIDLPVVHCLLASQRVSDAWDLDMVISHKKALEQCSRYLWSIGIPPEKRSLRDSTGSAAKMVARIGGTKIGAIASHAAAEEYGLKIIAEGIQDDPDNKTTFVLLENKAIVDRITVGIIGIEGNFGRFLEEFFTKLGCLVIGSDIKRPKGLSNAAVVKASSAVIFAVPIEHTAEVIRSVLPDTREDQLLIDITSIKRPAIEAMLESNAQVLGLHPMFRPEVPFDGQTVVACPARLTVLRWRQWAVNMLAATGATIKWSTAAKHDNFMGVVQVIPHLGNLVSALLIMQADASVRESLEYTSPFYRVMFSLMGRLVSQNPDLYTSIIMENPNTMQMLVSRIAIEQELLQMIHNKDREAFKELFVKANKHFGTEVTTEANELFMRLLSVLSTLYGKNSVTLEFAQAQSRPGLLERILQVFSRRQINLTGINSVMLDGGRLQFTISFEQSRASDEVRRALEEIENWDGPRMYLK